MLSKKNKNHLKFLQWKKTGDCDKQNDVWHVGERDKTTKLITQNL